MLFREHLYQLSVNALDSLNVAQSNGKVPKNPLSESHFFSVWVSKSLKEKSFDVSMVSLLKQWQQRARTQGAGANLKSEFESIKQTYEGLDNTEHVVTHKQITALMETLTTLDWQINIESHISKKHSVKKEKHSSLVMTNNHLNDSFDSVGILNAPISLFIRGENKAFIDSAYQQGMLVFKVTDYKSIVKFHGEFIIAPNNNFTDMPEFIT